MESWHLPNLSVQIAPDCISEYLNFQNFPGGMPPDPPSKSRLRRSKWALSRPYCQYSELCHARAYKQKKARNAPAQNFNGKPTRTGTGTFSPIKIVFQPEMGRKFYPNAHSNVPIDNFSVSTCTKILWLAYQGNNTELKK